MDCAKEGKLTRKLLKIAALPLILVALLAMGGCVSIEHSVSVLQKVSSSENKKVFVSLPVVVEKDMETRKTPDATEKAVADETYAELKKNLNQKGLLANQESASFGLDLRVHYVNSFFAGFEYTGTRTLAAGNAGGQVIITRAILKKDGVTVTKIDSVGNTGMAYSYQKLTGPISAELANQIEKILMEGISVGKSP